MSIRHIVVWAVAALAAGLVEPALAADPVAGKTIFERTCANCHSTEVGVNKVGPSLWHVLGRKSASVEGYAYSSALRSLATIWTADALNVYLENPRSDVHGVKMFFKGLPHAEDRENVIAYLQSLG